MEEVYAERGQAVPLKPKTELPELEPGDEQILWDYNMVRTDRPVSGFGGLLPIPWSKLHHYAVHNGYDGADLDWFIRVVQRIDCAMIEDANSRPDNAQ